MKELVKKNWKYILYEDKGSLLLSVVCGTVALFDRNIRLNESEQKCYQQNGVAYLDKLASDISYSPEKYQDRHIVMTDTKR